MSDVQDGVKVEPVKAAEGETKIVKDLFELVDPKRHAWRQDFMQTVADCYEFKELKQWKNIDRAALEASGVPEIPVDRINRGLDTILGIRANTGSKKRVVKRETGDDRVAMLLDKVADFYEYDSNFADAEDEAFANLLDIGIGIVKEGYDPEARGGLGEYWSESVNIEDFWSSPFRHPDMSDATWCRHRQVMEPGEAYVKWPKKAGVLKGLVDRQTSEWERLKSTTTVSQVSKDYGVKGGEPAYSREEALVIDEFWVKRVTPIVKVSSVVSAGPDGQPLAKPIPITRVEDAGYQAQEGENALETTSVQWIQFIVAGGEERGVLVDVQIGADSFHPFTTYIAQRKKSGAPRGYIEISIPHQTRINLAWAQTIAYNNNTIKSPMVLSGPVTPDVVDQSVHQSAFGAVLILPTGVEMRANQPLPLNTQSIQEGLQARQDMDFAAAATEQPLRGVGGMGDSGIKLSMQQNASLTPLNKWVKAEQRAKLTLWRKRLQTIIRVTPPEKMFRIVGQELMFKLLTPEQDRVTGMIKPGLQLPLAVDATQYDVVIEDQSVSDFNKQQSFNAAMALNGAGFIMDAQYMIGNAPIKNPEEALASHERAKADLMLQMQAQIEMLTGELEATKKLVPKGTNQTTNATTGRNASQSGQRSMVGGQGTKSPVALGAQR